MFNFLRKKSDSPKKTKGYVYNSREINQLRTLSLIEHIEDKENLNDRNSPFKNSLIKRINDLKQLIHKNEKFQHWIPDYSTDSFNKLGEWIIDEKFNENSEEIIFDIGAYFGEVLIESNKKLYWDIEKDKRSFDYNFTVISGFKSDNSFNPVRVSQVCFNQIASKKKGSNRFTEVLEVWKGFIQ